MFTLFLEGHAADEDILRQALPAKVFDAFATVGLLVRNRKQEWRTPGLLLMATHGLYLAVSIPPGYPTARDRGQQVYLGDDSLRLIPMIPPKLENRRVLDVCAGSGIHALLCAMRGAPKVVALEINPQAVNVARFNVALNGFADRIEVRQSDVYSALGSEEVFDLVVSSPPSLAVPGSLNFPGTNDGGATGFQVLERVITGLGGRLAPDGKAMLYCLATGDQHTIHFNAERLPLLLEQEGLFARAYAQNKLSITDYRSVIDTMAKHAVPRLTPSDRAALLNDWQADFEARNAGLTHCYEQILGIGKTDGFVGLRHLPSYSPVLTDVLFGGMQVAANT
jgi:SAM-dependent methyltransferase